jgi:squalene cyclase
MLGSPAFTYESPAMRQRYYRHVSEGGWPFSTAAHGWPISDCTAEGLKAVLPHSIAQHSIA